MALFNTPTPNDLKCNYSLNITYNYKLLWVDIYFLTESKLHDYIKLLQNVTKMYE